MKPPRVAIRQRSTHASENTSDARLTDQLACEVMRWRIAPGRYIKSGRSWIARWRFSPLARLEDAFQLLDQASGRYQLTRAETGRFSAEIHIGDRIGRASGRSKPRVISVAVARALGWKV